LRTQLLAAKEKEPMIAESSTTGKANTVILGIIAFAQALIWPCLVVYALHIFESPLRILIERSNQLNLEVPGFKFNVSAEAIASSAAKVSAAAQKQGIPSQQASQNIAQIFSAGSAGARSLSEGKILWVDENPSNNILLINAFQDLGVRVFLATSTDQAESLLSQGKYDVVISDMVRPPDAEAGKTIIKWISQMNISVPVIIYAANWAAAHQGQEQEVGALRITNDPSIVYHLALRIIQRL
jgi:CheY-like chemotaxis protein